MKYLKMVSLCLLVMMVVTINASCKRSKVINNPTNTDESSISEPVYDIGDLDEDEVDTDKIEDSEESLISPDHYSSFQIVKTNNTLREDKGDTLFVLVPAVNLELRNHVIQTKNLIKKLVVTEKRPENISILVFDDQEALEKVFENPNTEDLNVPAHYLARYDGSPAEGVYQYTLVIFPIAPDSNPAIQAQTDTIEFNPYEW